MTVLLCAAAAYEMRKVYFDYNLLNMQSAGLPAVVFEGKLIEANKQNTNSNVKSVLFGAVIATNLSQAAMLEQQLTNLPAVAGVESLTHYLLENQTNKLVMIGQIKNDLANLRFLPADESFALIGEQQTALHVAPQKLLRGVTVINATFPIVAIVGQILHVYEPADQG